MEIIFSDENGDQVMSVELIRKVEGGDLFIQIGHCEDDRYENVPLDEFEKALAFLKNNG